MKVLIADGNRHLRASGYGALSRAILLALKRYSDIQIVVEPRQGNWDQGIAHESELMEIVEQGELSDIDVVLRIGTPEGKNQYGIPTIVYTQNALGDLPPTWIQSLSVADAIVVPGEFDANVFRKYFKRVFTCPQFVDPNVFKPYPSYRQEGVDCLSFLFVGSYSYRKGVDLLIPAFAEAFADGRPVHLRFHCFSGLEKDGMNHLLQYIRHLPKNIEVSVFNGSLSPSWMNRIYNRHDVVISFSRGEGWCMPLHEGLLCGKPVIAPNSTAMGEALPVAGVRRVKVNEQQISQIQDTFGGSMKSYYGHPGNICWEVDFQDAVAALKEIAENIDDYRMAAVSGRKEILEKFTLENIGQELSSIIFDVADLMSHSNKLYIKNTDDLTPALIDAEFSDLNNIEIKQLDGDQVIEFTQQESIQQSQVLLTKEVALISYGDWIEHSIVIETLKAMDYKIRFIFNTSYAIGTGEVQILLFCNDNRSNFFWFSIHRGLLTQLSESKIDTSWMSKVGSAMRIGCDRIVIRLRAMEETSKLQIIHCNIAPVVILPHITAPTPSRVYIPSLLELLHNELTTLKYLRDLRMSFGVGSANGTVSINPSVGLVDGGQPILITVHSPRLLISDMADIKVRFDGWSACAEVSINSFIVSEQNELILECVTPSLPLGSAIRKDVTGESTTYPQTVDVSVLIDFEIVAVGSYLYSDIVPYAGMPILLYPGCEKDIVLGWINLDRRPIVTTEGRCALWEFHRGFTFFQDNSVDAITISHMLMYLPVSQHSIFLADCFRVLKRGGVLRITEDNAELRRADDCHYLVGPTTPLSMRKSLNAIGFAVFDQYPNTTKSNHKEIMRCRHMDLWDEDMFLSKNASPIYFIEGVKPLRHYSISDTLVSNPFSSDIQEKLNRGELIPKLVSSHIEDVLSSFVADPFLFHWDGDDFLFFESRTHPKAAIGVACREGDNWKYIGIALNEDFHLSFPMVFEDNGQVYMLPESAEVNELRLYRAVQFPIQWKLDSVLLTGKPFVDSAVFKYNESWWVISRIGKELHLFFSDTLKGSYTAHPANPIVTNPKYSRLAGRIHVTDVGIFRFSQDCTRIYGETVALHQVTVLNREHYAENVVTDPFLSGPERGAFIAWNSKIHHVDFIKSKEGDQWLVVFDATDTDTVPKTMR